MWLDRRLAALDIQRRRFDDDQAALSRGGGAALQRVAKKRQRGSVCRPCPGSTIPLKVDTARERTHSHDAGRDADDA